MHGHATHHNPMRRFINPLLLLAAHSRRADLIRQIHYLKVENEILRSRLGKRVMVTPRERERLVRYARKVGPAIKDLVSIVVVSTMLKWLNAQYWGKAKGTKPRKAGRPRTPEDLQALVIRIARETGWGYTRILGELKKLGMTGICRSTVVNILKRAGLDPSPERKKATWDEFIKRHAETLWACDFMPRKILTLQGWREAFVLVFINLRTRKAWVSPSTLAPGGEWTAEQTKEFLRSSDTGNEPVMVMHDNDTKFQVRFQAALKAYKAVPIRLQLCSPNLNAYAERFIQTLQQECLDHFVIFGCRHMDHLVREFLEHYHTERPHQSLDNQLLARDGPLGQPSGHRVECDVRLGGVLKHYRRAA
jgi:putative transposase